MDDSACHLRLKSSSELSGGLIGAQEPCRTTLCQPIPHSFALISRLRTFLGVKSSEETCVCKKYHTHTFAVK